MKKSFLLILSFLSLTVFSQTNSELLNLADGAFKAQNYIASSRFYKQILVNMDSGAIDATYAYEIITYNPPPKKNASKEANSKVKKENSSDSSSAAVAKKEQPATISAPDGMDEQRFYAMERLALSYKLLRNYEKSEVWYKKLYDLKPQNYAIDYAKALMTNGKYKEAMDVINNLMINQEPGTEAFDKSRDFVKGCVFALRTIENKSKVIVLKPIDSAINNRGGAFGANYAEGNSILFSSSRPDKSSAKDDETPANSNIYKVALNESAVPTDDAQNLSQLINTEENEGAAVLSADKTKLYFTRWDYNLKKPECAIYVSKYLNGQWLSPRKLKDNINVPGYRTMHPALSPDGTTLYFSSDRPGGIGKQDVWYCTLDGSDNATEVKNPGTIVNTPENEVTPYVNANNYLYFSSDGLTGLGGLDIYKVSIENGFTPPAKNLGSPINSNRDDAYYISDESAQSGFLSSDRGGCINCGEGSCYQIYYFEDKPILITISGKVYNIDTKEPIANSMIAFIDVKENYDPIYVFTDDKGGYKTKLNKDVDYFATAQKKGFFKDAATLTTMGIKTSTDLIQDWNFSLKAIPPGEINIAGIEYDLNSANLRPGSKVRLDSLVEFLELNNNLVVEINSHTDLRGNDMYNMKLSEARAKSVVDYLIENGIEKERLVPHGYGETTPLIADAKTEEEHQKNRRTTFKMLSQDFQPLDKYKYIRTRQEKLQGGQ
jgi:outer membrane protein OmpA-like peptidoglycan-associated protein